VFNIKNQTAMEGAGENVSKLLFTMLVTLLFGFLALIVLFLLHSKSDGYDSKSVSEISMTVAIFGSIISIVGLGVAASTIKNGQTIKLSIFVTCIGLLMSILLCCFALDMSQKWFDGSNGANYAGSIVLMLVMAVSTIALFCVICTVAYKKLFPSNNMEEIRKQKQSRERSPTPTYAQLLNQMHNQQSSTLNNNHLSAHSPNQMPNQTHYQTQTPYPTPYQTPYQTSSYPVFWTPSLSENPVLKPVSPPEVIENHF
jgi:hypothetical protein